MDYAGRHVMRVSMGVTAVTNTAKMWFSTIDVVKRQCQEVGNTNNLLKAVVGSRSLPPLDSWLIAQDAALQHELSRKARAAIPLNTRIESEFPVRIQQVPGPDSIAVHPFVSAFEGILQRRGGITLARSTGPGPIWNKSSWRLASSFV